MVGPEKPLVDGIVDYLESYKIKVFGPNKISSQLEAQLLQRTYVKNLEFQQQNLEFLKI